MKVYCKDCKWYKAYVTNYAVATIYEKHDCKIYMVIKKKNYIDKITGEKMVEETTLSIGDFNVPEKYDYYYEYLNKNNNCKHYKPTLLKRILDLYGGIVKMIINPI